MVYTTIDNYCSSVALNWPPTHSCKLVTGYCSGVWVAVDGPVPQYVFLALALVRPYVPRGGAGRSVGLRRYYLLVVSAAHCSARLKY
jgi:hypothetical protein